ncbi:MAG: bifunctional riboflavin kinase/FMN adenylyltransferase, partial [Tannerella sp.]|nr:bifunctional riboflavin kinase/FMN adenylyltransferase [Tannerella sp.]
MKVIYDINDWKEEGVVATVGFFDGVHPGHRFLLDEMKHLAQKRGLPSAVVTFGKHPRMALHSDYQPALLNSFDEKIERLAATGVDYAIVMDFTIELASLTAQTFISEILAAQWKVKALLIGYDHRFGHNRSEGFDEYVIYGMASGMEIIKTESYNETDAAREIGNIDEIDKVGKVGEVGEAGKAGEAGITGIAVSSSTIRRYLANGNVAAAARLLGYRYRIKGKVVEGFKIGRSLGFPTANIAIDDPCKAIPADGLYAVTVNVASQTFKGILYIGSRPTFDMDSARTVEVNIFDFSADIYNKTISIEFVEYVRKDLKFDSPEALR